MCFLRRCHGSGSYFRDIRLQCSEIDIKISGPVSDSQEGGEVREACGG